jgi:hypothetical protein
MRDFINILNETMQADEEGWTRFYGPTVDVTGDDIHDFIEKNDLKQTGEFTTDEGGKGFIFKNPANSIKLVATPWWDARVGQTYSLSAFKKVA